MKKEQILYALSQINENYVADAASTIKYAKNIKKDHKILVLKYGVFAACFALIGFMLYHFLGNQQQPDIAIDPDLPLLKVVFEEESMGFEALMFYDISESDNSNPWSKKASLNTLPVYKNLAYTDESGTPIYLSKNDMETMAEQIAEKLQKEVSTFEEKSMDSKIYGVVAFTENAEITVNGNGATSIKFLNPVQFPSEYSFADIFDFDELEISNYCEYTFQGEQKKTYAAYEKSGDLVEDILNYNFQSISFIPNQQGELMYIKLDHLLTAAKKIGEYPIITSEEAMNSLLKGEYLTTVPDEYLENGKILKKQVEKVELIYRSGNINEVFMPFYRFYIKLPEIEGIELAEGLNLYGIYYVPAVYDAYLK